MINFDATVIFTILIVTAYWLSMALIMPNIRRAVDARGIDDRGYTALALTLIIVIPCIIAGASLLWMNPFGGFSPLAPFSYDADKLAKADMDMIGADYLVRNAYGRAFLVTGVVMTGVMSLIVRASIGGDGGGRAQIPAR